MEPLGNLFRNLPDARSAEVFQPLAAGRHARIERIVSFGQASPPGYWYDQPQHEFVVLIAGEAELQFEDEERSRRLVPGNYVLIAANRRHRVESTSTTEPTVWLAVHYD